MIGPSVTGRPSSLTRGAVARRAAAGLGVLLAAACASGGASGSAGDGVGAGAGAPGAATASSAAVAAPARDYLVYVVSEATDEAALIRFGAGGATIERRIPVGIHPADPDGPHGVAVSPDGGHYFVTTGHGVPYGYLWKLSTATDEVQGRAQLGLFPASLQVTPDGMYAYAANYNPYGAMEPSSISIVSTADMVEVARLTTCTMPHGSRFDPSGARHYSTCMMDDMLIEIDTRAFEVARHFVLTPGAEAGRTGAPSEHAAHALNGTAAAHALPAADGSPRCAPTWAVTSVDGARVFVACSGTDDIVEIDVATWRVLRRIPAGDGVYNLDVTHDGGTLIATNKRGRSVSLFDIASGREVARIETQRPIVHGIAVSDDDRYAFVSVEGIGSMPGTVEVIDLAARQRVASVDVGQMSGGIAFRKSEPAP